MACATATISSAVFTAVSGGPARSIIRSPATPRELHPLSPSPYTNRRRTHTGQRPRSMPDAAPPIFDAGQFRSLLRLARGRNSKARSLDARNGPKLVSVNPLKNRDDFLIHRVVLQNR